MRAIPAARPPRRAVIPHNSRKPKIWVLLPPKNPSQTQPSAVLPQYHSAAQRHCSTMLLSCRPLARLAAGTFRNRAVLSARVSTSAQLGSGVEQVRCVPQGCLGNAREEARRMRCTTGMCRLATVLATLQPSDSTKSVTDVQLISKHVGARYPV